VNLFQKKVIIECTQAVTQEAVKRIDILYRRNEKLSPMELVDIVIAESGLSHPGFSKFDDYLTKFNAFVFAAVQYRLAAGGRAEWILDKDFPGVVIEACSEYLNNSLEIDSSV